MDHDGNDRLSQFYDVAEIVLTITRMGDCWSIQERHRHLTGRLGQCRSTSFDRLTAAEALDVLCAHVYGLQQPAALSEQPQDL